MERRSSLTAIARSGMERQASLPAERKTGKAVKEDRHSITTPTNSSEQIIGIGVIS